MDPGIAQQMEEAPNSSSTAGVELEKDRLKALYELAKDVLQEEDNRRINIEDKAAKFTTILGILLGAAGFFGKWLLDQQIIPPHGKLDWFALACVIAVFATVIAAWVHSVLALRPKKYIDLSIDDEVVDYFWDNNLETIYTGYAKCVLLPVFQNNRKIIDGKARLVMRGHWLILAAACLLTVLLILVGAHAWSHSPSSAAAENNIPIEWLWGD